MSCIYRRSCDCNRELIFKGVIVKYTFSNYVDILSRQYRTSITCSSCDILDVALKLASNTPVRWVVGRTQRNLATFRTGRQFADDIFQLWSYIPLCSMKINVFLFTFHRLLLVRVHLITRHFWLRQCLDQSDEQGWWCHLLLLGHNELLYWDLNKIGGILQK